MIGIDEVGRGCLAGPLLVVAARASKNLPTGLKDSKALTKPQRLYLAAQLQAVCEFGEGWVSVDEINTLGLSGAMKLGVDRALNKLDVAYDEQIIMDGKINYCAAAYQSVKTIIKADDSVSIVSAASIYAKVARDAYMAKLGMQHINYGFENHNGYGTKAHFSAIARHGLIAGLYRLNYKPIKLMLEAS